MELHPLYSGDVAAALGVSRQRVRQLDPELQPRRSECGVRIYDQARVDYVTAQRDVRGART